MISIYRMKLSLKENLIYLAVWGLLFATPLLSLYVRTANDTDLVFDWTEVFIVWRMFAVYLVLFIVHNFLLAPLLIHKHKRIIYYSIMVVMLVSFAAYQYNCRPKRLRMGEPMEMRPSGPPPHDMMRHDKPERHKPPHNFRHPKGPSPIIGEREILAVVVLILMFGANLGIKVYFRGRDDRRRLAELERQNLEQQLEYLRYQINPHFFMNTLNNIHALVDIDPEKAKDTILELSKMMRFVLYEGNKQGVPLSRELDFIRHYVALMQLRYTDKVRFNIDLPQEVPDRQIPPLILITFIENAYKHGISYQHDSFIEVKMTVKEDRLNFVCHNSKADKPNQEKGGVGLTNARKRLDLLYGNDYTLRINNNPDDYTVELNIPL